MMCTAQSPNVSTRIELRRIITDTGPKQVFDATEVTLVARNKLG